MINRGSGILMHITSLPSRFGVGDFGPEAYRFADFLDECRQCCWQILPLTPTDPVHGNSPYSSASSYAINPLLLSPELMVEDGFLRRENLDNAPAFKNDRVDYAEVAQYKRTLFEDAYAHYEGIDTDPEFAIFCDENERWLGDYALFIILKKNFEGKVWNQWPVEFRDRHPETIDNAKDEFNEDISREKLIQYLCYRQWFALKKYCNEKGIQLFGDIPIYVNYDSADVWSNPNIFKLDENKDPKFIAGVPPDYFSENGQLWGNPVYDWKILKDTNFKWWISRLAHNFRLFDIVRIDHFRGFVAYWEVPAGEKTAINGKWIRVPVDDFFRTIFRHFILPPIVAEDLGMITADVREALKEYGLPGMKILIFGMGSDNPRHPYLPHNIEENYIVYTATHDNNTVRGWFENEIGEEGRQRLFKYLGREVSKENLNWELIRAAMLSRATLTVFPTQDILGLGGDARMNRPAYANGNWGWRMFPEQITPEIRQKLKEFTHIYGRD